MEIFTFMDADCVTWIVSIWVLSKSYWRELGVKSGWQWKRGMNGVNEGMQEWMDECRSEWISEWVSEWMNDCKSECWGTAGSSFLLPMGRQVGPGRTSVLTMVCRHLRELPLDMNLCRGGSGLGVPALLWVGVLMLPKGRDRLYWTSALCSASLPAFPKGLLAAERRCYA